MNTSLYNNLAIQMHAQPLNNRPVNLCDVIFRHVREDFIDITTRTRMCRETHCIGLNLKCWFCMSTKRESRILITWFCQSIKRKTRKQIPPKSGIKIVNYSTNLILQAVLTQPEKDSLSFFACWLICSNRSSSKRICFIVLFERSKSFFSFFSCIGNYQCDRLDYSGNYHYIRNYIKKAIPQSTDPTLRDLTTITLTKVMIMANSNDTLCPKNGQYDLPNLLSVLNLYQADIQPQNLLHAKAHLEELRQSILWGIGAIGNLLFWASECEEYEEQQFKDDTRDIGYLLAQLKNVVCFASNQINLLDDKLNHKEINDNE